MVSFLMLNHTTLSCDTQIELQQVHWPSIFEILENYLQFLQKVLFISNAEITKDS
jgi:hypothetical protein